MIIYHDDLRFHADEWTPLHALHISQKGTINLGFFFMLNVSNYFYLVTLTYGQLTQASFLQKNQMLQNVFLIFATFDFFVKMKLVSTV